MTNIYIATDYNGHGRIIGAFTSIKKLISYIKDITESSQLVFNTRINSNFLPDDLDTYLRNLSRHDFLKTLWAFLNQPKRFRKYFNRSWYLYRMFFSPLKKDKELKQWAISIHKAFTK